MTRLQKTLILSAVPVLLSACSSLVKEPTVSLAGARLSGIGISGATLAVELLVENPNRFSLDARSMEYTLSFLPFAPLESGAEPEEAAWRTLSTGRTASSVTLPGRDTVTVPVSVPFSYSELGSAAASLLRDGTLRYRFVGSFTVGSPVGEFRIPFDRTGILDP